MAYIARLVFHRYAMLGVLSEDGLPLHEMGILSAPGSKSGAAPAAPAGPASQPGLMAGKPCPECGNHTLIQKDGCEFCTACGFVGQCG